MAAKSGVGSRARRAGGSRSRDAVRAAADLLGIDPLHVANEGKAVLGVRPEAADAILATLRAHPLGRDAADRRHLRRRTARARDSRHRVRTPAARGAEGEPLPTDLLSAMRTPAP